MDRVGFPEEIFPLACYWSGSLYCGSLIAWSIASIPSRY